MSSIITASLVTSGTTDQSHTSVGFFAAWSSGSLIVLNVGTNKGSGTASTPTAAGSSVWTQTNTVTTSTAIRRNTQLWSVGDGSSSTVTIDYAGVAHTATLIQAIAFQNAATNSGPIQSGTTIATTSITTHTELSSLTSTVNLMVMTCYRAANNASTGGSGYTGIGSIGLGAPAVKLTSFFGNSNLPDATHASSVQYASIGAEFGLSGVGGVIVGATTQQRGGRRRRR